MIKLVKDKCTGCGICVMICPHGVYEFKQKKAVIAHEYRCVECGACQLNCHFDAIKVTKGTGCLVAIIQEDILKMKTAGCA